MTEIYALTRQDLAELLGEAFRQENDRPHRTIFDDDPDESEVVESVLRTAKSSSGYLAVSVQSVQLFHDRHGPDRICLELGDALAREIHGEYFAFWQGAHLDLQCAGGHGEVALAALGLKADEVTEVGGSRRIPTHE